MAAPNINPFENVKAMVGSYGTPADVEIRNLFANSDDDGILYIYMHMRILIVNEYLVGFFS